VKSFVTDAIFSGFSSRADGSCGFRGTTPELTATEKAALMELHGKNVRLLIEPSDYEPESTVKVEKSMHSKTPSQRLRAILFVQFRQQQPSDMTFDSFYVKRMGEICEREKSMLEPEH